MHIKDFAIFSLGLNFARCLASCMPSSPLGVYKPLIIMMIVIPLVCIILQLHAPVAKANSRLPEQRPYDPNRVYT